MLFGSISISFPLSFIAAQLNSLFLAMLIWKSVVAVTTAFPSISGIDAPPLEIVVTITRTSTCITCDTATSPNYAPSVSTSKLEIPSQPSSDLNNRGKVLWGLYNWGICI
jgi:hypothetical protein